MIEKTWRCLLLALITIFPIAAIALPAKADTNIQSKESSASVTSSSNLPSTLKIGETRSQSLARPQSDVVARIFPHQVGDKPAATVYVRNLPVLTFVSPATTDKSIKYPNPKNSSKLASSSQIPSSTDPIERASATAALFNQLARDGFDASAIVAVWQSDAYILKLGDKASLKLDNGLMAPDFTKDKADDALRTANLLRRLLGSTPSLTSIVGIPVAKIKPSFSLPVAVVSQVISGMASWYGPGFHGGTTANGERFNQYKYTAAHPNLPFGTPVRVTNMYNGRSVVVRINDRGPYTGGRVIDLSKRAAQTIGLISSGVGRVKLEVIRR